MTHMTCIWHYYDIIMTFIWHSSVFIWHIDNAWEYKYNMIFDDIWWYMMIYDGIWWYMMVYDDIWWYMLIVLHCPVLALEDGSARVWNADTGHCMFHLTPPSVSTVLSGYRASDQLRPAWALPESIWGLNVLLKQYWSNLRVSIWHAVFICISHPYSGLPK